MTKGMMKSVLFLILFLVCVQTGFAASWFDDPIIYDEPNEKVFDCRNDIFIEVVEDPVISKNVSNRTAENNFLYLTVRVLYLADEEMAGLDKSSFILSRRTEDNTEVRYPLNFMVTMLTNRMRGFSKLTGRLYLPSYRTLSLVFDVDTNDKQNWELVFLPTERGSSTSYCEINVPLKVR